MKLPRYFFAVPLLLLLPVLFGCQKHDPRVTRAFWDREYEHHLHEIGEVPDYARLYFPGTLTPKEAANQANWMAYISKWRKYPLYMGVPGMEMRPSLDEILEEAPHGHGHAHDKAHPESH